MTAIKRVAALVVLALIALVALDDPALLDRGAERGAGVEHSADAPPGPSERSGPIVPNVSVRDIDGRIAWRGDIDLGPEIARIERGQRDTHRNDGTVFGNRERRLPQRPRGYYREFVVRTPGIDHAGPQRLVIGRDGDAWYTPDHYRSFLLLEVEVSLP